MEICFTKRVWSLSFQAFFSSFCVLDEEETSILAAVLTGGHWIRGLALILLQFAFDSDLDCSLQTTAFCVWGNVQKAVLM